MGVRRMLGCIALILGSNVLAPASAYAEDTENRDAQSSSRSLNRLSAELREATEQQRNLAERLSTLQSLSRLLANEIEQSNAGRSRRLAEAKPMLEALKRAGEELGKLPDDQPATDDAPGVQAARKAMRGLGRLLAEERRPRTSFLQRAERSAGSQLAFVAEIIPEMGDRGRGGADADEDLVGEVSAILEFLPSRGAPDALARKDNPEYKTLVEGIAALANGSFEKETAATQAAVQETMGRWAAALRTATAATTEESKKLSVEIEELDDALARARSGQVDTRSAIGWMMFLLGGMFVLVIASRLLALWLQTNRNADTDFVFVINDQTLIEFGGMCFILLTIVILGSTGNIDKATLGTLLGTIAGYIFGKGIARAAGRQGRGGASIHASPPPPPPPGQRGTEVVIDAPADDGLSGGSVARGSRGSVAQAASDGDGGPSGPEADKPPATDKEKAAPGTPTETERASNPEAHDSAASTSPPSESPGVGKP